MARKPKVKIKTSGVDEVMRQLGRKGARELAGELEGVVEDHTLEMANEAADNAPYKSGALANSIVQSVEKEAPLTWRFGSDRAYATRQEYEHETKKGFFRKALWRGRQPFRDAINEAIKRRGR